MKNKILAEDRIDIIGFSKSLCTYPILVELKDGMASLLLKSIACRLCEAQEYLFLNYGCGLLVYDVCNDDTRIDVVLADISTKTPLDMGSIYNFFDPISSLDAKIDQIGADACRLRYILSSVMQRFGFIPNKQKYWQFTYQHPRDEL